MAERRLIELGRRHDEGLLAFRFIHTADLHLDSPLRTLALRDPALAEQIGDATRAALVRIVDLCLEEGVDALLIAGDLYDGDQVSMKTARFLAGQLKRLDDAAIRVFIVRGNHDAASRITRELVLPDAVTVFGGRGSSFAVTSRDGSFEVRVHGVSFADPRSASSLLPKFQAPVDGAFNIGLMHTSLDGSPNHDVYAPCAMRDLMASGFRYWALGHIHSRAVHLEQPCAVVMPGMPQGRDIGESGAKSATLATVYDDGSIAIEKRATCIAQFERVEADLGRVTSWRDGVERIGRAIAMVRAEVGSEILVVRPRLTGATTLAWRIRRDGDLILAEAMQKVSDIGRTFIDAIENATEPQADCGGDGDALGELRRLMADEVRRSPAHTANVTRILEELRGQLPADCRNAFGNDAESLARVVARAIEDGSNDIVARLRGSYERGA